MNKKAILLIDKMDLKIIHVLFVGLAFLKHLKMCNLIF
jgi:hypothetical protein